MWQKILIIPISLLLILACKPNTNKISKQTEKQFVKQILDSLLPDKRDAVFEFEVKKTDKYIVLKGKTDKSELKTNLFKILHKSFPDVLDSIQLLPDKDLNEKIAVCRLSVANLRSAPKHSAELVTQVLTGMPMQLLEKNNGFYRVKTPENYYAWVDAAGIEIMTKKAYKQWVKLPKAIAIQHCGKLYQKPSEHAQVVADFVLNDVFALLKKGKNFSQILLPDGRKTFIDNKAFLDLHEFENRNKHIKPELIVNFAKQYLGIPYLWGGTSTKALDCSGFSKNLYAQAGYLLPRDASQQVKIGKKLPVTNKFEQLQAGDLLFFGRIENGKQKITHVAVHINDGLIIHATGEVKIESLNPNSPLYNSKRRQTWLQARRLLGIIPQNFVAIYKEKSP